MFGSYCDISFRFESSTTQLEKNDYIEALYNKLRCQTAYHFLDNNVENKEILRGDSELSSSPELKEFLSIVVSTDQTDEKDQNIKEIQQEFCEKFHNWTAVSQLRVGYLMYLDKRINSSDYLSRVIKHLLSSFSAQDIGPHDLTALLLLIYFKRDLTVDDMSEYLGKISHTKNTILVTYCLGLQILTSCRAVWR